MTTQLPDLVNKPVEVGMPEERLTRRLRSGGDDRGILIDGYKFRPAERPRVNP